jgi:hypothetical protein
LIRGWDGASPFISECCQPALFQEDETLQVVRGRFEVAEGELGTTGFEEAQVEHGGKWSPVKTYRRSFPKGAAGNVWALQATLLRRAFEPPLAQPLRVVIAVTLRSNGHDR